MVASSLWPSVLETAQVGEWIAGVTPVRMGLQLAFLMRVNAIYSRANYWTRFRRSRHDSIYEPLSMNGHPLHMFKQHTNAWHDRNRIAYDVDVDRVLLSGCYFNFAEGYDGYEETSQGLCLPSGYQTLLGKSMRGAGHFKEVPLSFLPWVTSQPTVELSTIDEWILP